MDGISWPLPPAEREREAAIRFRAGNAALEAGCHEGAYRLYRDALSIVTPIDHPELIQNISLALERLGRPDAAAAVGDLQRPGGAIASATSPSAPAPNEAPSVTPGKRDDSSPPEWSMERMYKADTGWTTAWKWILYVVSAVVGIVAVVAFGEGEGGAGVFVTALSIAAFVWGWWV
jgi:hypothetical protein